MTYAGDEYLTDGTDVADWEGWMLGDDAPCQECGAGPGEPCARDCPAR